jgi:hypothetical protein
MRFMTSLLVAFLASGCGGGDPPPPVIPDLQGTWRGSLAQVEVRHAWNRPGGCVTRWSGEMARDGR